MNRNVRAAAFLLLSIAAAGSGAMRASALSPASSVEIPVAGHINAEMAARLHPLLNDGKPHTVRVSSSGGDDLPALALAQDIRRNHAILVVDGVCAGACANYLFVAAARRIVQPGALVIFGGSATARLAMVPPERIKEVTDDDVKTAQLEKQLLKEAGINPALLLEPLLRLQTDCFSLTSHDRSGKAYINYRAHFVGWVPSRSHLARMGVAVTGFWPDSVSQFQAILQGAFPGGARGDIAYSGTDLPSAPAALLAQLHETRECDTGLPGKSRH